MVCTQNHSSARHPQTHTHTHIFMQWPCQSFPLKFYSCSFGNEYIVCTWLPWFPIWFWRIVCDYPLIPSDKMLFTTTTHTFTIRLSHQLNVSNNLSSKPSTLQHFRGLLNKQFSFLDSPRCIKIHLVSNKEIKSTQKYPIKNIRFWNIQAFGMCDGTQWQLWDQ